MNIEVNKETAAKEIDRVISKLSSIVCDVPSLLYITQMLIDAKETLKRWKKLEEVLCRGERK